ncbi:helix-turn-helix domain-containing protein [Mycolicibacterium sp. 018/SC-01/001]|uniref:GlxA family transcriptional regulator n=1 Tax=Mycolicibacterium sp. 018/SC-01/001 TaxID=2592069 RepID=UPI00117D8C59|nr:helix-turn-helix domain-containing protein [Mycolicibacterium sp. 018/SC-01/001]TRW80024.1 helix-turn-helix domain-containing protein [Mycolicibacterium sp. 018/SC-01/001]
MIIAVLAQDGVMGFELMIPGTVFGMANEAAGTRRYEVRVCGRRRRAATTADWGGVEFRTSHGLDGLAGADLVIVPGVERCLEPPHPDVIAALRAAFDSGARIASMCVGAFTVAATGLLSGRRVTTHWQWADELARRFPDVDVDPSVLFIDEGPVVTAAGVASGLDLCLHIVRGDAGPALAGATARRVVIPAWRDGGQAQYVEHAAPAGIAHPLRPTIDWMREHAEEPLDLSAIAAHAAVSVRTLNRQFRDHVGTTPLGMLTALRIDRARRLLEGTALPVDRIAEQSGFGSYASLRHHFLRTVGVSPQKYRQNYVTANRVAAG